MYNLTNLTGVEKASDLVSFGNEVTGGLLVGLLCVGLFFVFLFRLKRWDFDEALLVSSFIVFVISGLLAFGGFVQLYYPLVFLALCAFTAFYMFVLKR